MHNIITKRIKELTNCGDISVRCFEVNAGTLFVEIHTADTLIPKLAMGADIPDKGILSTPKVMKEIDLIVEKYAYHYRLHKYGSDFAKTMNVLESLTTS
jgi:hypothetical protein